MTSPGPDLDAARARVVELGLTSEAVGHLTGAVSGLPFEGLAAVKQLLKQFFSERSWTSDDDEALADAVGDGEGWERRELAPGLTILWGWADSRFQLRVESEDEAARPGPDRPETADSGLGPTFDGVVVPEATPSPRTIRFAIPGDDSGPSRAYDTVEAAAADPRVEVIFEAFDEVTNVLVASDFVAVTIARPDHWEVLLGSMLDAVTRAFTSGGEPPEAVTEPVSEPPTELTPGTPIGEANQREPRQFDRAWIELGGLRADRPEDLEQIVAAAADVEPARRQVAAALLTEAPAATAAREWGCLLGDRSRSVRRSAIDAIAGTEREDLRPLLERALDDADAWARWKALRGIAALGVGSSHTAVTARLEDPDFRVRLEATRMVGA